MRYELLFGPPGTGKTTTLLGLVEEELERGTPPDRIGFVSFTTRAAEEAVSRAAKRFNLARSDFPYFRTLHSLCFQSLGLKKADVLEGKRLSAFGETIGVEVSEKITSDEGSTFGFKKGDRILFMENLARVRGVPLRVQYDAAYDGISWWEVERFARALERYKAENNLYDFTDMLTMFVERGYQPRIDVLFVDEAQDLSRLQWQVVRKLASTARRVIIAGDDDQAIYRWAGADVEHLIGMEGDSRVLEQSWRVPVAVQRVAAGVIRRVQHRVPKMWNPRAEDGQVDWLGQFSQVDLGEDTSTLILARNNYLFKYVFPQLQSAGVLYEYKGHWSINAKTLDAIMAWTDLQRRGAHLPVHRIRNMYEHMQSGRRIKRGFKTLKEFADEDTMDMAALKLRGGLLPEVSNMDWYDALDDLTPTQVLYLRAIFRRFNGRLPERANIRLSTIHGMKGGEANKVVLLSDMAQRTYEEMRGQPEDEARVWYVAVTRARQHLQVIKPTTRRHFSLA